MSKHLSVEHTRLAAENDPELPWSSATVLALCDRIAELEASRVETATWAADKMAQQRARIAELEALLREAREYVVWWECIPETSAVLSPLVTRIDDALAPEKAGSHE